MLQSQQALAPTQLLLKRVNDQLSVSLQNDLGSQPGSDHLPCLPWPETTTAGTLKHLLTASASSFAPDSTPKSVSQLFLDGVQLQLDLPSLEHNLYTTSGTPSTTTEIGSDGNLISQPNLIFKSSPVMSAGSNYNFDTPSLHQVSALTAPFSTSSPTVGSVGTVEAYSGRASPSQHEESWTQPTSRDRKLELASPGETFSHTTYSHKSNAAGVAHQASHTNQAQLNDHGYQSPAAHPGHHHYFHQRASISGPLMDSAVYAERYEASSAAPAPPRVHGLAAWENASGFARPHTADGMFGQFGVAGAAAASHEGSAESSTLGTTAGSNSRSYTPAGHAANVDPYYQNRRMSMPDPSSSASGTGAGKVFSYMASGEDGATHSSSGVATSSHNYSGHYFGGSYGGSASKKRPRRRYDEIERLYSCSWPGCTKSYGTLNHLNAHVAMQKHGPKRSPSEFKDMRKAWRKQKKEEEQRRQARNASMNDQALRPSFGPSGYADMSSGHSELVGGPSGTGSALPIGLPPASSAFGHQHAANALPAMSQLTGPSAHLGRYSMSSVSATPNVAQPYYVNSATADAGLHSAGSTHPSSTLVSQHHHDHTHNTAPLQYTGDNRLPYNSTAAANTHYPNFSAYLSAHRGSI